MSHLNIHLGMSVPLVCRADVLAVPFPWVFFLSFFFLSSCGSRAQDILAQ